MANSLKEISSLQNPLIKHLVHLRQNHDYREEHQSILLEGLNLVYDICPTLPTKVLVVTDPAMLKKNIKAEETILVSPQVFKKISGVQSPEGILAEVAMPKAQDLKNKKWILALDGVSDPGNLGTLIRTALALGWEGAFLLSNSCDPYNDKALRAAKGATLKLPLSFGDWSQLSKLASQNKIPLVVADLEGTPADQAQNQNGAILVLGNEAHGPSKEAEGYPKIMVPMPGNIESLNVAAAGAILMYLLPRKSHG